MDAIGIRMHGVRMNLRSDHAPLLAYAAEHLHGLAGPVEPEPDLEMRCLWSEGEWDPLTHPFAPDGPVERIGKRMLGSPDELIWLDTQRMQGLQLRLRRERSRWSFELAYRYHPRPKHAHELDDYRFRKYFSLMSYLVYYPVFWRLERTRGAAVVHASCLGTPRGAVLIGGLGGVGKTTLSVALSREPGFTLGAENLTVVEDGNVHPCHEPIRLDPASLELLGPVPGLTPMRFPPGLKAKHLYHAPLVEAGTPWPARAVFLPRFTRRHLRRLDPGVAMEKLRAMNHLTLEIDDYAWFASVLDLHWPCAGQSRRRLDALDALARRAPCFELGVDTSAGVAAAVADVLDCLERVDAAAGAPRPA